MERFLTVERPCACALAAFALATAGPSRAQTPVPLGPQFQVNSYTSDYQRETAVAAHPNGRFAITWWSEGSSGSDTSSVSVQAQRYGVDGAARGDEFQVNSYTTSSQFQSAIAATPDGGYIVVWSSEGSGGTDYLLSSVQGQRYAADGSPLGAQFQVNSYTTGVQWEPFVAVDPDGDFIVAWESGGSAGTDTSHHSIQAQRFDASAVPQGAQFQVNSYTTFLQGDPAVAIADGGSFVVVWHSSGSSGTDSSNASIQGQRYAADGSPLGSEFQVNDYTTSQQLYASVAAAANGDYVVAWTSLGSHGTDSDYASVQARRFAPTGTAQGLQFQVNTHTWFSQGVPSVSAWPNGDFIVSWDGEGSGDDVGIFAQRYLADGSPDGSEFMVNSYTAGGQYNPSVATASGRDFVVAWESIGSPGSDVSFKSIQARRFGEPPVVPALGAPAVLGGIALVLFAARRALGVGVSRREG